MAPDNAQDSTSRPPAPRLPEGGARLGVRLAVPPALVGAARYALRMLLLPLGLEPDEDARAGLWYGVEPPPEGDWVFHRLDPETTRRITSSLRETPPGADPAVLFPGGVEDEGDLIASAFYWLAGSDYEAHRARDRHGRVVSAGTLLARRGLLEEPPVDRLRGRLAARLEAAGHRLHPRRWSGREWAFCPTIDVDYLRKWRPGIWWREAVEYGILGRGPGRKPARLAAGLQETLVGPDPYRSALERIRMEMEARGGRGTFFIKAGATSPHDVPYRPEDWGLRRSLAAITAGGHGLGLHPSYHAFDHPDRMREECGRLARAARQAPDAVRMHYLRWDGAATLRAVGEAGLALDSTLGFPDAVGFRNGTCLPFEVWDHARGEASGIWEMPLALMESAVFNRQQLSVEEAVEQTSRLAARVRREGGVLVALWHNVLWDEPDFAGWGAHFIETLDLGQDAATTGLFEALEGWRPA